MKPIQFQQDDGTERTFTPHLWDGMKYIDGEWYPHTI